MAVALPTLTLLAAFLAGPFFPMRPTPYAGLNFESSISNIDGFLNEKESRVEGLKHGLEKSIQWADPATKKKTPLSIVYLHGFSSSRRDLSPVIETLGNELKANVFFTRFEGHGIEGTEGLLNVKAEDWMNDAREAFEIGKKIGDRVILVGVSTGATLAMELALELAHESDHKTPNQPARAGIEREKLAMLLLLSPNFRPSDPLSVYLSGPIGTLWAKMALGSYRSWIPENELQKKYWSIPYRVEGIVALMNLCNHLARQDLGKIKVPTLVLYTPHDKVVSVDLILKRFSEIGSDRKKLGQVEAVHHHEFAGDAIDPHATRPVIDALKSFIEEIH